MWNKIRPYAGFSAAALAVGGLSALLTGSGMKDFAALNQPPLSPPGWIFPAVWTILYVLMGVSFGILRDKHLNDSNVKLIYYIQLIVNLLWPIAFFVLKWRLFAFIWILILDALVVLMIFTFYKRNKTAALLQLPYLAWVLFASYLNLGVYILNG